MKIALQLGAPEPDTIADFMQHVSPLYEAGVEPDSSWLAQDGIIAAYDADRLVGLGGRMKTPEGAADYTELKVYVASGYEDRDIPIHIEKLLRLR